MPTRARVDEFIRAVKSGAHADAIADFYTEDSTMQEPGAEPRRGRAHNVERERKILESAAELVTHDPDFVALDGDHVAIHWRFEFTHVDGRTRVVDEVAIQSWRGDRIATERYFYDKGASDWKAAGATS